jgi:hypothetical protein
VRQVDPVPGEEAKFRRLECRMIPCVELGDKSPVVSLAESPLINQESYYKTSCATAQRCRRKGSSPNSRPHTLLHFSVTNTTHWM